MKKTFLLAFLAAATLSLQAQDTVWQKPAPQSNYFYNNWFDTTEVYALSVIRPVFANIVASRFISENDSLDVYGIAAMMLNFVYFTYQPSSLYPTLGAYLAWSYPDDPTFDNCEESLMLYQYHGASTPVMQQLGDSLPVHMLNTPVSYRIMSNTSPVSTWDARAKPVYERYFSTPQRVADTFYVGFTCTDGGFSKEDSIWHVVRPEFGCAGLRPVHATLGFDDDVAVYRHDSINTPFRWDFLHNSVRYAYFIFPILTPPDTTLNPTDTLVPHPITPVNPVDTLVLGEYILHPGNTLVIAPGDTLVIGGDTLVNNGDTLTVTLGDTAVIAGIPFVVSPGDTLLAGPGDTLFVGPDGSITVNPGGTIVVGSGSGANPGVAIQKTDMLYRYTAVSPNPATGRATVTSSFGLERIDAYDAQGRLIASFPDLHAYRHTLDTQAWPRGTCLLRIHTPLGTTTKKLLLQ